MDTLRSYLRSLSPAEKVDFATRCGTTIGYLHKALSAQNSLGEALVINIERESAGAVRCEDLRPDVDWAFLRGTAHKEVA